MFDIPESFGWDPRSVMSMQSDALVEVAKQMTALNNPVDIFAVDNFNTAFPILDTIVRLATLLALKHFFDYTGWAEGNVVSVDIARASSITAHDLHHQWMEYNKFHRLVEVAPPEHGKTLAICELQTLTNLL